MGRRPDRELARRIDQRDARPDRRRGRAYRDSRRDAAAREPFADRRRAGQARGDRHGADASTGARAVRAIPARGASARTRAAGRLDCGGRAHGRRRAASGHGCARNGDSRRTSMAGRSFAKASRIAPTTKRALPGSLASREAGSGASHRSRHTTARTGRRRSSSGAPERRALDGSCAVSTSSPAERST